MSRGKVGNLLANERAFLGEPVRDLADQLLLGSPMLATTTVNSLARARSISFASWYREARQKKIWPEAG